MDIEIIIGYPQQKPSAMSQLHPWLMKHHMFVNFIDYIDDKEISVFIEDVKDAEELAEKLIDAYNSVVHWIEKQEEREE